MNLTRASYFYALGKTTSKKIGNAVQSTYNMKSFLF